MILKTRHGVTFYWTFQREDRAKFEYFYSHEDIKVYTANKELNNHTFCDHAVKI